ncbi:hypothetical protein [Clostridium sp. VAP41]|uniref:DUF7832 domain-containing protein n=2 Tax=unclassified Clostridium TaxID=2614128 RepID=UPI002079DFCD|nr:hypothetical protein [Clostridium sp. VAP41]
MACFDSYDRFYDKAMEAYCSTNKIKPEDLSDEQNKTIIDRACIHIGFYITWIIKHNLQGDMHNKYESEDLEKVRKQERTGVDFFLTCCDGNLWDEDFNERGLAFTEYYYASGQFIKDYIDFVLNELCDLPCEFAFKWEDYIKFEIILDRRYKEFCKNKK